MTEEETARRAGLRDRHKPSREAMYGKWCQYDSRSWPCDIIILLDQLEAAETRSDAAAHLIAGHRDTLINALAIAWGASLPGSATIDACPDCGCQDPQCGDSTWDHECEAQRLCDTHTAARAAAANFAHLEQALRALPA